MINQTIFHPEGFRLLRSVTCLLDKLPFYVMAKKEVYSHPLVPDVNIPGLCGTFFQAIQENKPISTYTDQEHAVTLLDIKNDIIRCKNSYSHDKVYEVSLQEMSPIFGHFISFKKITERTSENITRFGYSKLVAVNLEEMGFCQNAVKQAVTEYPLDFQAALDFAYSYNPNE